VGRFGAGRYEWKVEAKIGTDVFPGMSSFGRRSVDALALQGNLPYAVVSTKWGMRHDRIRDPQEEADRYKAELPDLKFFVVTNEFDSARLGKLVGYPGIDGVFHVRRELVSRVYDGIPGPAAGLKDLSELFPLFL
jgi:hypothetical protein